MLALFQTVQAHAYSGESIFDWNYFALLLKNNKGVESAFDIKFTFSGDRVTLKWKLP